MPAEAISDFQLDVLQEVCNIGLGNAATALADILHKKIEIAVPKACFVDFEEVFNMVGGLEEVVACVSLDLEGDVPGTVLFIFNEYSVYRLLDMLFEQEAGTARELDELSMSAVMEIGNVLTGSFVNAIGNMTGLVLQTTVPMFAFDMMGAILSTSLVASGHWEDRVLVIETLFHQQQEKISGLFFLLPETGALGRLFTALGIPSGGQ